MHLEMMGLYLCQRASIAAMFPLLLTLQMHFADSNNGASTMSLTLGYLISS